MATHGGLAVKCGERMLIVHGHCTASGQAHAFLAALVGIIQPVAQSCFSPGCAEFSTRDTIPSQTTLGTEGTELLAALEKFIVATVASHTPPQDNIISAKVMSAARARERLTAIESATRPSNRQPVNSDDMHISRVMQSQELPLHVRDEARRIVFNDMPIRMLFFDASGRQIQLFERNQVLSLVLSHIAMDVFKNGLCTKAALASSTSAATQYAILSHTWIREVPGDVVYQDWSAREQNTLGYAKISRFCGTAAREHGLSFGWMDTVCINKDSSSELDESIRAMYRWYHGAAVCVAYLAETKDLGGMHGDVWFTRGWTLQELLAPKNVAFYNKEWEHLGSLGPDEPLLLEELLESQIEKATTLTGAELAVTKGRYIAGGGSMLSCRVMQLAAMRTVTREEDKAYSIMGLLDVQITISYGEGLKRALLRLSREALASTAFILDIFYHGYAYGRMLLTSNIRDYLNINTRDAANLPSLLHEWIPHEPVVVTHLGVRISLLLIPALDTRLVAENTTPRGAFSGAVSLEILDWMGRAESARYSILNGTIYQQIYGRAFTGIAVLGIINFIIAGDTVVLPERCLAVPLACAVRNGVVDLSTDMSVLPVTHPVVFALRGDAPYAHRRVRVTELAAHGMQLATVHLP